MNKWLVILCAALCALTGRAGPPTLVYREAQEQVVINGVVFAYESAKSGFVSKGGDWVAWDDNAGNWLLVPSSGGAARFGADGVLLSVQKPAQGKTAPPRPESGYDPAADLGDTGRKATIDSAAAWDYLGEKQQAEDGAIAPGSGDDGGPPVEDGAVGGNIAARETAMRQQWALRPGAHSGDRDGAMNTGEVVDPIKQLMDTVDSIQSAVKGVDDTMAEVDAFRDQMESFGEGDYDYTPTAGANADDTRIEDDFGTGAPVDADETDMMQGNAGVAPRSLGKPPVAPAGMGATPPPAQPAAYGPAGASQRQAPPSAPDDTTNPGSARSPQETNP